MQSIPHWFALDDHVYTCSQILVFEDYISSGMSDPNVMLVWRYLRWFIGDTQQQH